MVSTDSGMRDDGKSMYKEHVLSILLFFFFLCAIVKDGYMCDSVSVFCPYVSSFYSYRVRFGTTATAQVSESSGLGSIVQGLSAVLLSTCLACVLFCIALAPFSWLPIGLL